MSKSHKLSILVVDDEASIREALAVALTDRYHVRTAASGAEACACLRAHPVAAIILDEILGEEHGLDLVPRFRRLSPARIMLFTGQGSEDLAARALRVKVDDYLKKPPSLAELNEALARLVPRRKGPADLVAQVQRHLDEHFSKPLDLARLAGEHGVSEVHLRWLFRTVQGKTPSQYLTEIRIRQAASLLRTTPWGVERIALEVGYPNAVWFNKQFRRAYAMTPSAFRASQRLPEALDEDRVAPREADPQNGQAFPQIVQGYPIVPRHPLLHNPTRQSTDLGSC